MRKAEISRNTNETNVFVALDLDGDGKGEIATGVGFFDHMMQLFLAHSRYGLTLKAKGDTQVDFHHTVEDAGIALGAAFAKALGDKGKMISKPQKGKQNFFPNRKFNRQGCRKQVKKSK